MSSLFSIWACDPTPYVKPSPACQQTLYCGTLATFSKYFILPRRRRRWLERWQQRQWHLCLQRLLKLREGNATWRCVWVFYVTFHKVSEASHESLFAVVSEMILFRIGIDARILSSVRVIFSKCLLIMSRSMSNNWLPIPISQMQERDHEVRHWNERPPWLFLHA